ncbi:hypothetical protein [Methyloceanibacter caenitepidi]|uniref:Uncharacterized protein n=1 Tax=Methyloceanibacter caenitepidi TaxID=1384459 RepID=A0A0A8K0N8_9HYPH|nr:hypothetical protein [Methyloceanibacter caenitepidi]BAQ16072.1 hypothetical protein GL4_0609 [Methyloceanibacter caenitepidi]
MTIQGGSQLVWTVRCDFCDAEECVPNGNAETFFDVIDLIKKLGWRVFRMGREWKHQCPKCREEEFAG